MQARNATPKIKIGQKKDAKPNSRSQVQQAGWLRLRESKKMYVSPVRHSYASKQRVFPKHMAKPE
jgi:hypothetical protein